MLEGIAQGPCPILGKPHHYYLLAVNSLPTSLSILSVTSKEVIDHPWHYTIEFTSSDKAISKDSVLIQPARFSFLPQSLSLQVMQQIKSISSLDKTAEPRRLYGVVTQFSQLSISKDDARYQVVLEPRLALLGYRHNSAIYQHQSVVSVVESILRSHGLTGVDFRSELADVGIRLTFESSSEHSCDVIMLSDNEKGYADGDCLDYTLPGGLVDLGQDSPWDLSFIAQTVEKDQTTYVLFSLQYGDLTRSQLLKKTIQTVITSAAGQLNDYFKKVNNEFTYLATLKDKQINEMIE